MTRWSGGAGLHIPRGDPEGERDEREHRDRDDERVTRPPVGAATLLALRAAFRGRRPTRHSPFDASWMRLLPDFSSRSSFRLPRRSASSSMPLNERKP